MKKLLLLATLSVAGLMSANETDTTRDTSKENSIKETKLLQLR